MKHLNKLLSLLLCAVIFAVGFAAKPEFFTASALSSQTTSIGPASQTITWGGFSKYTSYTFNYSRTDMFSTASTSFNGNDTFSFKVNTNYTTSKRTGYIYAKKNGTTVATLTVKQDGIVLTVTPVSYTGSVLNGNGQEITYKVSSNMKVDVYRWGDKIATTLIGTYGKDQTKAGVVETYTTKIKYAPNVSSEDYKYIGIRANAYSACSIKTYTQPVHTHYCSAMKYSGTKRVYGTCSVSGCGEELTNCTYRDYRTYTNKSDSNATRKAFLKLIYGTKYSDDFYDGLEELYEFAKSNIEDYSIFEVINNHADFLSNTSDLLAFYGNDTIDELCEYAGYYCIGRDMYNLLTAKNTSDAIINMRESISGILGIIPHVDKTYGKVVEIVFDKVDTLSSVIAENFEENCIRVLADSGYNDLTLEEICTEEFREEKIISYRNYFGKNEESCKALYELLVSTKIEHALYKEKTGSGVDYSTYIMSTYL